jgi:hypothetical protein
MMFWISCSLHKKKRTKIIKRSEGVKMVQATRSEGVFVSIVRILHFADCPQLSQQL